MLLQLYRIYRLLPKNTLLLLAILLVVKLFINFWNYEERTYVSYESYPHFSTGEALITVNKNDDTFSPVAGIAYTALLTTQGRLLPLKNQFLGGTPFWSKDGSVVAFKGGFRVAPSTSGCIAGILNEVDEKRYLFAYDFSTHHEICSSTPTWQLSKSIVNLIKRHGGTARKISPTTFIIGMSEQEKFEKADVNQQEHFCD